MTKPTNLVIAFLVLVLIAYAAVYLYAQYKHLDALTGFEAPIKLSEIKEVKSETSLNIIVREKDFLLKYQGEQETVTKTEEILAKYHALSKTNPKLTVTYKAKKGLEFLRIMIPFSDLNVIPPAKLKFIKEQ